jgi:hypothetical protein
VDNPHGSVWTILDTHKDTVVRFFFVDVNTKNPHPPNKISTKPKTSNHNKKQALKILIHIIHNPGIIIEYL